MSIKGKTMKTKHTRFFAALAMMSMASVNVAAQSLTDTNKNISDESISADYATYGATQSRIKALNDTGRPVADYHLAKAQCWLDVSLHEYTRNDRSLFPREALNESVKLIAGMETKKSAQELGWDTPLINGAPKLRQDLWANIESLKSHQGFACAAQKAACAEVELVHAGNEHNQQQWRHGKPYIQIAENNLAEAKKAADTCSAKAAASVPQTTTPLVVRFEPATATATAQPAKPVVVDIPLPTPIKMAQEPLAMQSIILFNFDKRDMNSVIASTKTKLDELISKVQSPDITVNRITVTGHADRMNIASVPGYNTKLAQDRAQAAKSYMVSKGVDVNLISVASKADSEQIETCTTRFKSMVELQQCLASNRRVEVIVEALKLR
jgi:outer membrane protein OmpA-like peptidoglycan-associated protein